MTKDILLDWLKKFRYENNIEETSSLDFSRPALLTRNFSNMKSDYIYVCRLSEAMRATESISGMHYLCIRDRLIDDNETKDRLRGTIIINENLDSEDLFMELQSYFYTLSEWQSTMQKLIIQGGSLQDIITLSEPIIGNTINVSDSSFNLLARTTGIDTDDPISVRLREAGHHTDETLELFRKLNRYKTWEKEDHIIDNDEALGSYTIVNRIFRYNATYFTHVVMVCDHHPVTNGLVDLFNILNDVLSIYIKREWDGQSSGRHIYESFLTDMLNESIESEEEIESRAHHAGLQLQGSYHLIKIKTSLGSSIYQAGLERKLSETVPDSKILSYDNSLVILHRTQWNTEDSENATVSEQLENFMKEHDAIGGASGEFNSLLNIKTAYLQASLALKYHPSKRIGYHILYPDTKPESIQKYREQMHYCLLGESPSSQLLWQNSVYGKALRKLYEYDTNHKANNLHILYTYLSLERSATDTGNALHMHRNNVLYHIGRIRDIIELDLDDKTVRIELLNSLALLEIYGL